MRTYEHANSFPNSLLAYGESSSGEISFCNGAYSKDVMPTANRPIQVRASMEKSKKKQYF